MSGARSAGRTSTRFELISVRTRRAVPPRDDIYDILSRLPKLKNGDVVFITSKILAIHQGHCVKLGADKKKLIRREAERILPGGGEFVLTIKGSTLIPSAGIDESNGNGYYILWPKDVQKLLREIRAFLKKKYSIARLGVVATDSHTVPLRWGVVGTSIGGVGIEPLADHRGKKDVFGRKLRYTKVNIVDPLAALATLAMGESGERTPILIMRGARATFSDNAKWSRLAVSAKKDLYYPLLKALKKT